MALNTLSNEQQAVLKIVSTFGCMDIAQVYALYEPLDHKSCDMFINWLVHMKRLEIKDGRTLVLADNKSGVDLNAISCIWTMLKLRQDRKDVTDAFKASDPALAYMTVGGTDAYILVPVKGTETVKVRAVQEKIAQESKSKHFKATYVFITTDEEVKSVVKETEFDSTVLIALLNYNKDTRIPEIKTLKKTVK